MPDVFVSEENKPSEIPVGKPGRKPVRANNLPFLTSFCHNPVGIEFKSQEPDEHITLFLRRHFVKNFAWMTSGTVFLILPLLLLLPFNFLGKVQAIIPFRFIVIFVAFYYLIVIGFIFVSFITWFYNVGIVTTKQVIDIDFTDLMYREVAKARIEDIVDVEFIQGGFLHSFFDYGDVFIQTEGVKPNFEFGTVPHPDKITDIILDLKG